MSEGSVSESAAQIDPDRVARREFRHQPFQRREESEIVDADSESVRRL
jgi:hypothetical protein